jgi:hypothetical protein
MSGNESPPKNDINLIDRTTLGLVAPVQPQTPTPTQLQTPDEKYNTVSLDLDKPWNMQIMYQLKKMGDKSMGLKWMHAREMIHYERIHGRLTMLSIVIVAIMALLAGGNLLALTESNINTLNSTGNETTTETQYTKYLEITSNIVYLVLAGCQSVLIGIQKSGDYPQKIQSHRWSRTKYDELFLIIQNQLALPVAKRENDAEFLKYNSKEFNEIMAASQPIRDSTRTSYIHMMSEDNIFDSKIEIVVDSKSAGWSPNTVSQFDEQIKRFMSMK